MLVGEPSEEVELGVGQRGAVAGVCGLVALPVTDRAAVNAVVLDSVADYSVTIACVSRRTFAALLGRWHRRTSAASRYVARA